MAADIRPARASDVDALLAIENAVFPTDRLSGRSFRRLIASPSAAVLVADAGKGVAGYAVLLVRAGSPTARLYSIAAAPGVSGQGVGRALLGAAEREAARRGRRSLRLEVREDNARAIAIYRLAGFEPTGREADYYQDGMAAMRLKKELGGDAAASAGRGGKGTFPGSAGLSRLAEKIPGRA
ncbi:MAG TPA: GNAT family N-acetyltransferase [Rhizobiaceae bacterium]